MSFLPFGALESIRADLGLSYTQAGVVLASVSVGGLLGNLAAIAADHVDRRWLSSAGALVYAVSMAGFALGRSFPVLVIAAVLLAIGSDAMISGTEVALVDVVRTEHPDDDTASHLSTVLARQGLGAYVGDLLGPLTLSGVVAAGWSWRWAFAVGAAACAIFAVALARQPLPPPHANGEDDTEGPGAAAWRLLRDRRLLQLGLLSLGVAVLDEEFAAFLIAYLQVERGLAPAAATALVLAEVAGGLTVSAVLAARRSARGSLRVAGAAVGVGAVIVVAGPGWASVAIGGFLFGAGVAASWFSLQARVLSHSVGRAGTATAVVALVETPAMAAPVLAGALTDAAGLGLALAAHAAVAVAFALGCALADR